MGTLKNKVLGATFLQFLNNYLIVTQVLFLSPTPSRKTQQNSLPPPPTKKTQNKKNQTTHITVPVNFFPLTDCKARVTVDCLNQFFTLVTNNPVWIILGCSFGIQGNHLKFSEISLTNFHIFRADIINVWHTVLVKVIFASISTSITCKIKVILSFYYHHCLLLSLTAWELKSELQTSDCPGTWQTHDRSQSSYCINFFSATDILVFHYLVSSNVKECEKNSIKLWEDSCKMLL